MFSVNQSIGDYVLQQKIGEGAFGEVWLAERRSEIITTQFALKLPKSDAVDTDSIRKEARVWKTASGHPNILPIIEANIYDGQVVIVSEFASGGSLRDLIRRGVPSVEDSIDLTIGILNGLEHLHKNQILHRDLKPENILMQEKTPRLTDFGISKLITSTTAQTKAVGTPSYMSPEAFDGKGNKIPSDLWSVAVILYEIITGNLPFPQKEFVSLIGSIVAKDPEPLPKSVNHQLSKIILKGLHKDPNQRYQTASSMKYELQKFLNSNGTIDPVATLEFDRPQQRSIEVLTEKTEELLKSNKIIAPAESLERNHPTQTSIRASNDKTEKFLQSTVLELYPNQSDTNDIDAANNTSPYRPAKSKLLIFPLAIAVLALLTVGSWLFYNKFARSQVANTDNNSNAKILPSAVTSKITPDASIEMAFVWIPAGKFLMGSNTGDANERPVHLVTFSTGFWIGKFEVTQTQWETVMGNKPSHFKNCQKCPVEQVSWDDVQQFLEKLNAANDGFEYSLPSESQWEYAARAGTTSNFAFGNKITSKQALFNEGASYDNIKAPEIGNPIEVGHYKPNNWGIFDMHGNVDEWCADVFSDDFNRMPDDGSPNITMGDPNSRTVRGGSYLSFAEHLRSSNRSPSNRSNSAEYIGFRIVATKR